MLPSPDFGPVLRHNRAAQRARCQRQRLDRLARVGVLVGYFISSLTTGLWCAGRPVYWLLIALLLVVWFWWSLFRLCRRSA
jgi:hypothetical protein